jgi:hypothetical protein
MPNRTNAQPSLGIRLVVTQTLDLAVEVAGPCILVRTPEGNFRVTYRKSPDGRQLALDSEWGSDGKQSASTLAKFRIRAWRLANDTASELGWFEQV